MQNIVKQPPLIKQCQSKERERTLISFLEQKVKQRIEALSPCQKFGNKRN